MIGINLWLIPQISEHWPYIILGFIVIKIKLFNWFGIVSILIFKEGIDHEWITSKDVNVNMIW